MDFSGALSTVLTITSIIAVAIAGLQRGLYTNLKDGNAELRARDADRDKLVAELKAENETLKADLAAAHRFMRNETQIAALSEEVIQQGADLRQHRANLEQRWDAATKVMGDFSQQILDELRRRPPKED